MLEDLHKRKRISLRLTRVTQPIQMVYELAGQAGIATNDAHA